MSDLPPKNQGWQPRSHTGHGGSRPQRLSLIRRRTDITFQEMPDGSGVLVDPQTGESYALNATAAAIWRLCDGAHSCDQIVDALLERYEAAPETIVEGVEALLAQLVELGVAEPVEP